MAIPEMEIKHATALRLRSFSPFKQALTGIRFLGYRQPMLSMSNKQDCSCSEQRTTTQKHQGAEGFHFRTRKATVNRSADLLQLDKPLLQNTADSVERLSRTVLGNVLRRMPVLIPCRFIGIVKIDDIDRGNLGDLNERQVIITNFMPLGRLKLFASHRSCYVPKRSASIATHPDPSWSSFHRKAEGPYRRSCRQEFRRCTPHSIAPPRIRWRSE